MAKLYKRGWPIRRIGQYLNFSRDTVFRVLVRKKIARRHRSFRGAVCVDCHKPTMGRKRCDYHRRVHWAEMMAEYRAERPQAREYDRKYAARRRERGAA